MAIIEDNDIDLQGLRLRFQLWLQSQPGWAGGEVVAFGQASSVNGFSNETYRIVLRDGPTGPREEVILRLPPARTGFFPTYDIPRQYAFMEGLQAEDELRIARCRWLEADPLALGRPFFVTDFVQGQVPGDNPNYLKGGWMVDANVSERQVLWFSTIDQLIALAKVQWEGERLAKVDWADASRPRLLQHLDFWRELAAWGCSELPPAEHVVMDELQGWLRANLPKEEHSGIIWGDSRFGNVIYRDFQARALLDWELAVIGDPMIDMAYFLFHTFISDLHHGAEGQGLDGFPGDEEALRYYCERTGRAPVNYRYYWLFNAYKMLCIWQCKAALMLRYGRISKEESFESRRGAKLLPHIARVLASSHEAGAFLRTDRSASTAAARVA